MPRPPEKVTRRSKVPLSDAEWFDETYPAYGSWSWLIEITLASFRAQHTVTPEDMINIATRQAYEEMNDD